MPVIQVLSLYCLTLSWKVECWLANRCLTTINGCKK